MRFTITAPSLTPPTYETLEEYTKKKFNKLEKLIPKSDKTDHEVRISVKSTKDIYELTADIVGLNKEVVNVKDRDIRKAVDLALDKMKSQLVKDKGRRLSLRRIRDKIRNFVRRK